MNPTQIFILVGALVVSALILSHDLPIDFPWIIYKVVMLFLKLAAVWAVAIMACIFAARTKGTGKTE